MPLYSYTAFSKEGKKISGYIDANTINAVKDQLSRSGIYPIKIELTTTGQSIPWYKRIFQRSIGLKEKVFFTKQLSILLRAGIPLAQSLDLLSDQTEGSLQNIVISLKDDIAQGKSLADGLSKFPRVFDNIFISLVRAGEASGKLEVILDRLTDFLERRETLQKTIKSALRYPMIQLGVIILVVIGLITFVVPEITSIFVEQKIDLPLPTRILVGISNFVLNHYFLLLIFIIAIVALFKFWASTENGAYTLDKIKLKLPIIGFFAKYGAIVQFSRTLGMLLEGGVNLPESLNIVVKIVDNKVLSNALQKAKEGIIKQGKISHYLKETGLFPPMAIYLLNTGEQSGQLDTMLLTVAKYYEDELKETADNLSALISPIMLIVMALVVGFILFSIMAPIQKMSQELAKNV